MNQCWTRRNRSATELLNRGGKPRARVHNEAIQLCEELVVHTRPGHDTGHVDDSLSGTRGVRDCDCTKPCDQMVQTNRATTCCRRDLITEHFNKVLKPSDDTRRQMLEVLGTLECTDSITDSDYPDLPNTVECPSCNCVIDLEVVRAQETLKL